MGSKRISRAIVILFMWGILSCSGKTGRPTSGFEGPGPIRIAPNIINGEGELLFAGGITSHWIYGVNLTDFYPFDINGNNEGNKIDNFLPINDLAVTLDGRFLFAGSGSIVNVYDMLKPESPVSLQVSGWVTSLLSDPVDPAIIYITSWNGSDGSLYRVRVSTSDAGELFTDVLSVSFPGMLPIKVLLMPSTIQWSPPLLYILFRTPPSIRGLDYSDINTGFVKEVPLPEYPRDAALLKEGNLFYVIFEDSKIAKYTTDGVEIVQTETPGIADLPRTLDAVPMSIAVLPPASEYPERIIIPDGKGYVAIIDAMSGCAVQNTSYTYKGFTDAGEKSNPSIEEIVISSCNAKTEDWSIIYHGKIFDNDKNTGKVYASQDFFVDDTVNFFDPQINPGDLLSIATPEVSGEYTILEVIDQNTLRVDRTFGSDLTGLVYNIKGVPYLVKGSVSGIQKKRAYENEPYVSDKGAIGFKIISRESPVTEGDAFYLSTKGEKISLEGLPYGVAVDSSNLIYISNYASSSISVVDPAQLKVIDTLR